MRTLLKNQATLNQEAAVLAQVPLERLGITRVGVLPLLAGGHSAVTAGRSLHQSGCLRREVGDLLGQVGNVLRHSVRVIRQRTDQLFVRPKECALARQSVLRLCWVHVGLIVLLRSGMCGSQEQSLTSR